MTPQSKRPRETTNPGEKRRNPRPPKSRIWTAEERERHRMERDSIIEQAGLVTDGPPEAEDSESGRH